MRRLWAGLVLAAALVPAVGLGTRADDAGSVHATLPGVTSEVLVKAAPAPVDDPEMALARVTIQPGATIPEHRHTGTQIAAILAGELTYSVVTGRVERFPAGASGESADPEILGAGDTVLLAGGDSVVEHPGSLHQARNEGGIPVQIVLSVLYPGDEGPTVYAGPDATPLP